jgi:hypothetical protein
VTVLGTLPVKMVALQEGNKTTIDSTYQAWVGATALTEVKWVNDHTLTAVVPPGIKAGAYGLTLQSPFDTRSTKDALFEVRAGECGCTPRCSGKTCGDDGCGGTCGTCATGTQCSSAGTCGGSCTRSCSNRVCGDDGCGGACGSCPSGTRCSSAGTCACTPSCSNRACGDDGCGGTCGTCETGTQCSSSGTCVGPSCARPDSAASCDYSGWYYCGLDSQGAGGCCSPTYPYTCATTLDCYTTAAAAAADCGDSCQECIPTD